MCIYEQQCLKFQKEWQSTASNKTTKDSCYDQSNSSKSFLYLKNIYSITHFLLTRTSRCVGGGAAYCREGSSG